MTCAEFEILLCDAIDGTLPAETSRAFEDHRLACARCAVLTEDVAGAVAFMETAETVAVPPELLTKISFQIPGYSESSRASAGDTGLGAIWWGFFAKWLKPVLQPRLAMGMAMTILSFSMLGRLAGIDVRQLRPADLDPVKVWVAADDKIHRTWDRAVKYYESLRLVYEVQSRLQEWTEQEEEERRSKAKAGAGSSSSGQPASEPEVNR